MNRSCWRKFGIYSLDKAFWVEALVYASHIMNCLSLSAIGRKTLLDI